MVAASRARLDEPGADGDFEPAMPASGQTPPFSPALVAGLAARPLPPGLFQPLADLAMALAVRRHPEVFRRLQGLAGSVFLIDPIDLPFDFLLRPAARPPGLRVVRGGAAARGATARISGPLMTLIGLLEGRLDGDAAFFARDLVIEGDTAAVLALRNAVDGADIDLVDLVAAGFGPFSRVARRVLGPADALLRQIHRDFARLQDALIAPAARRSEAQAAELSELRDQVRELRRPRRRAGAPDLAFAPDEVL